MGKWEMVRLGDVCIVERGGSPRPIEKFITEDVKGINWIKIGDTVPNSMYITATKEKIKPEGIKKSRQVYSGDFLLSNSMSFGRPYILKIDGCIHDGWLLIRDEKQIFDKRFLYYHLASDKTYAKFKELAVGGVVNNLNSGMVRDLTIPLPPLPVQQKIADILDHAGALIEKRKAQIEKLDLLVKSQFIEMFGDPVTNPMGWEVRKLGTLSTLITKGSSPNWQGINYVNDKTQVLFITSENVREGFIDYSKEKYLEDRFNIIQPRSVLQKNDILINIVGASIGRAAIYKQNERANINQAVALVRCEDIINIDYLCVFLNSPRALQMYMEMQVDVARANLSLKNISDLLIICPPLPLQNDFAAFVERIETQKAQLKKSLALLELNYKSLMQKCFAGEIF